MRIIQFSSIFILFLSIVVSCQKDQPKDLVLEYGTLTDIDGNSYKTVKIGNSWWMCENLKVSRFNDGTPLNALALNDTASWQLTPSFKFFNDSLYGKLYNYQAVSDNKVLAPEGWHVASDADWKALERAIGMDSLEVDLFAWRGSNEANLILTEGSANWPTSSIHFGSNKFALAIQPGGIVQINGMPTANGLEAYFWTSTTQGQQAIYRSLSYQRTQIFRQKADMRYGMSIRCVKN
jgi:uncharacterized protein (TIGR02145 family)